MCVLCVRIYEDVFEEYQLILMCFWEAFSSIYLSNVFQNTFWPMCCVCMYFKFGIYIFRVHIKYLTCNKEKINLFSKQFHTSVPTTKYELKKVLTKKVLDFWWKPLKRYLVWKLKFERNDGVFLYKFFIFRLATADSKKHRRGDWNF